MLARKTQAAHNQKRYSAYLGKVREALGSELKVLVPQMTSLRLHEQIEYVLNTHGKQVRGAMVILAGNCVGGTMRRLRRLALAVELVHAATLVHDDILDQELFRRDALSVRAKYGVREAVLVGDALASLGLILSCEYPKNVTDVLVRTILQLSDGEYMDVQQTRAAIDEGEYFEKIRKKSASLFNAAAQCGALASGATPLQVEALAGFGENFGLAFQMCDDISDVTLLSNGVLPPDLNEFRATLPIIHFYQKSGSRGQSLLLKISDFYDNGKSKTEVTGLLAELHDSLENSGSMRYCRDKIDLCIDRAEACLATVKDSRFRTHLVEMAESLRQMGP